MSAFFFHHSIAAAVVDLTIEEQQSCVAKTRRLHIQKKCKAGLG